MVVAAALVAAGGARLWLGSRGAPEGALDELVALAGHRVAAGIIVGAALAAGGVLLQALLRNPLASPDLIGLASGAGLGMMVWAYVGFTTGAGIAWTGTGGFASASAAVLGAGLALAVVYGLSQRRGLLDPITLVLVGVIVGIVCSAAMMVVQHLMPDQGVAVGRVLLGALRDDLSGRELWTVGAVTGACVAAGAAAGPAMDAASLGEDEARSVGVRLGRLRALLFALAGILAASAVVLAGPIGFVGLICPHAARLVCGPRHRGLVIVASLLGALLVVGADLVSASLRLASGRLPINILTTLVGGPTLLVLLRREVAGR